MGDHADDLEHAEINRGFFALLDREYKQHKQQRNEMTKEIIAHQNDVSINWNDARQLAVLQSTVAAGTTPDEFQMFVGICKATGLNPFKKEIWCIITSPENPKYRKAQIMVGINGYHAMANNHPDYDGMEVGLVNAGGDLVSQAYPKEDYIGAWARVYRKDRRIPIESIAMLKDYDKQQSNWKTMRRVMILKVAESVALRKSFPQEMNGTYTQEEMPSEFSTPKQVEVKTEPSVVHKSKPVEEIPDPQFYDEIPEDEGIEILIDKPDDYVLKGIPGAETKLRSIGQTLSNISTEKIQRAISDPRVNKWLTVADLMHLDAVLDIRTASSSDDAYTERLEKDNG